MTNYYSRDAGLRNAQLKAKRKRQPLRRGCVLRRKQERLSAPRLFWGSRVASLKLRRKTAASAAGDLSKTRALAKKLSLRSKRSPT